MLPRPLRTLALWLVLGAASLAAAQSPKPLRVLFIGNSLTSSQDIPERVAKLAKALGREAVVRAETYPEYSLEDHWRDGRAAEAIRKGWDVVVLQQGSSALRESRAQLAADVKRFAQVIRDAGAKPALFMTWPSSDRMRDFPSVIAAYREAAAVVDAILLPAGEAWLRALSADKRLRLYGDTIHPGSLGADLAALTIYLTLFPAGPQEFDEAYVEKAARALEIPSDRRDALFDAATRAIDEPMVLK